MHGTIGVFLIYQTFLCHGSQYIQNINHPYLLTGADAHLIIPERLTNLPDVFSCSFMQIYYSLIYAFVNVKC